MTRLDVLAVVAVVVLGGLTAFTAVLTVRRARDPRWRRDQWIAHNATAGPRWASGVWVGLWCAAQLAGGVVVLLSAHALLGIALLIAGAAQAFFAAYSARLARRPPDEGWFSDEHSKPSE